jgi:hypothetical protein
MQIACTMPTSTHVNHAEKPTPASARNALAVRQFSSSRSSVTSRAR